MIGRAIRVGFFAAAIGPAGAATASATEMILRADTALLGKTVFIERRAGVAHTFSIGAEALTLTFAELGLEADEVVEPLTITVGDVDGMALDVEMFSCQKACSWTVYLPALKTVDSTEVKSTCGKTPRNLPELYERFYFCRTAYEFYKQFGNSNWGVSKHALAGWFEAAYKLFERTHDDGLSFVPVEPGVITAIKSALVEFPNFESDVALPRGYFDGMLSNIERASLSKAQRLQRSLEAGNAAAAREIAESIIDDVTTSALDATDIPARDATYINSLVRQATGRLQSVF
jgi:hypothetical protein